MTLVYVEHPFRCVEHPFRCINNPLKKADTPTWKYLGMIEISNEEHVQSGPGSAMLY
jgi:hypothetical protein